MENRRNIWRKFLEYSSFFWCSYRFGLCVLIPNWSNNRKYVLGKDWPCSSKQNLAPVLGNKLVRFLRKTSNGFWGNEIRHRLWGNQSPILGKSDTDFEEICHRFWGNLSPILGKSVTDFGEICHRFWGNLSPTSGNPPPTSGKFATDFGEIRHRLWENLAPLLGKSATDWGKPSPCLGKTGSVLDWLGTKLKSLVFGFIFLTGCCQKKSVAGFPKVGDRLPQSQWRISPKLVADFPEVGDRCPQTLGQISLKSVADFPQVGGRFSKVDRDFSKIGEVFPQNRWQISSKSVTDFPKSVTDFLEIGAKSVTDFPTEPSMFSIWFYKLFIFPPVSSFLFMQLKEFLRGQLQTLDITMFIVFRAHLHRKPWKLLLFKPHSSGGT